VKRRAHSSFDGANGSAPSGLYVSLLSSTNRQRGRRFTCFSASARGSTGTRRPVSAPSWAAHGHDRRKPDRAERRRAHGSARLDGERASTSASGDRRDHRDRNDRASSSVGGTGGSDTTGSAERAAWRRCPTRAPARERRFGPTSRDYGFVAPRADSRHAEARGASLTGAPHGQTLANVLTKNPMIRLRRRTYRALFAGRLQYDRPVPRIDAWSRLSVARGTRFRSTASKSDDLVVSLESFGTCF